MVSNSSLLVISKNDIETDTDKISTVRQWPVNSTKVKDLRRFLRLTVFYPKFGRGYSKIAKSLYSLLREPGFKGKVGSQLSRFCLERRSETHFTELIV